MLIWYILLKYPKSQNRKWCIKKIVDRYEHGVKYRLKDYLMSLQLIRVNKLSYLSTESTKERVPKMTQSERKVFVEKVSKKFAHSKVTPTTMNEEKSLEISELRNRVVACKYGL